MIFERVKSKGLSHISYFLGSDGAGVVIDPRRDCQVYLDLAQRHELEIQYIFETHRNEDYVLGSVELGHFTGAKIYHGPGLPFKYGETLKDGQVFRFGTLRLTALHTPGHTDESMCYVLSDLTAGEEPVMVFSGDTLFVSDVGRIDLYGPQEASRLAGSLYDSIFHKLLPLGDAVILCPGHGAGSVCGGAISKREQSTLGLERLQNPTLQRTKRADFIRFKLDEQHEHPPYFRKMEKYNLEGPPLLTCLPNPPPLSPEAFKRQMELGAIVVDTRPPPAFGGAHIKHSYSVWLDGLPAFAGWILPYDKPILLILDDQSHLEQAVRYLIRLGFDDVSGYLRGGLEAWYNAALPMDHLGLLTVHELKQRLDRGDNLVVLDVRGADEWAEGHLEGALHIYVGHLATRVSEIPPDCPVAVICNVGHRASLGASILRQAGYSEVYTVLGSVTAWKNAGYTLVR
ncbi:MAG: MBL fold metallo-hydrolase [Candidatus Bathyarchaeota archaeon]|nr:MAG: MBL fold metallo-hydrolase [Candidatus Bathyarchaeota archaeon]